MFNALPYVPSNWYWVLDDGRVFSSLAAGFVPSVPAEREFTRIADEATLYAVIAEQAPASLPRNTPQWAAYVRELIREEADRRIQVAISARTKDHAAEALRTAALTSAAILAKKTAGLSLTAEEQFAEAMYSFMFGYIRAVKAAQNQLEAELNEDYKNDARWPSPV